MYSKTTNYNSLNAVIPCSIAATEVIDFLFISNAVSGGMDFTHTGFALDDDTYVHFTRDSVHTNLYRVEMDPPTWKRVVKLYISNVEGYSVKVLFNGQEVAPLVVTTDFNIFPAPSISCDKIWVIYESNE